MSADLAALEERALTELRACADENALRAWNTRYFGNQGELALALKKVGTLAKEERPLFGQKANQVKDVLSKAYDSALAEEKKVTLAIEMLNSRVDVEMKGHPGYQCDSIEWAVDVCNRAGSDRLKILFDIYHVQIMDGDVVRRIREKFSAYSDDFDLIQTYPSYGYCWRKSA